MSSIPTPGPTGLSAGWKYMILAILAVAGIILGQLEAAPVITVTVIVAAIVYALPTIVSEFEGA